MSRRVQEHNESIFALSKMGWLCCVPFLKKYELGITGLETAIVLMAFVVVASVFAFAVLSTGLISAEKSKETALGSLSEASATLIVRDSVVGTSNSSLTALDTVKFTLSSATQADEAAEVSSASTVITYLDDDQALNLSTSDRTATWLIGSGPMLDAGEQVEITVTLSGLSPTLGKGREFAIQIKSADGAVVAIPRTTPVELKKIVELTTSSGSAPTPTPTPTPITITYQKGDGKGTVSETDDAELDASHPNTNAGTNVVQNIDGDNPHIHFVLKFPNIFGAGTNQIPLGSTITSATLTLNLFDSTDVDPSVFQLTEGWTESEVNWNHRTTEAGWTNAGADGTGSHKTTADGDFPMTGLLLQSMSVATSLQNWSNGDANEGWVFIENSNDGADFDASETGTLSERPKLTVNYTPP